MMRNWPGLLRYIQKLERELEMRYLFRAFVVCSCLCLLVACGEDPKPVAKEVDWDRLTAAKEDRTKPRHAPVEQHVSQTEAGGVKLRILPDNPNSLDCLSMVVEGKPGHPGMRWKVNGQPLEGQTGRQLCGDFFTRGDQVTAEVGTIDVGASMTVTIDNAPPRVTDISSTPDQVFAGKTVSVIPVAEDVDGDEVEFRYQWLVNGEAKPLLEESSLPGDAFTKGDTIQLLITPTDGFDDGEVYQSFAMTIPNAPPVITSQPPQSFEAHEYSYQVEASDPDDSELSFSLNDPPAGMSISASGLISWPLAEVEPGDYKLSIVVTDPDGDTATQEFTLTLQPQ